MNIPVIPKNALVLGLFALISTGILASIQQVSKEKIADNERQQLIKKLNSVIAGDQYDNDIYHDRIYRSHPLLDAKNPSAIFRVRHQNHPKALVISLTAADGYNGEIKLLLSVDVDGVVKAVRPVQHKETPGLGDGIEPNKSDWIHQFAATSLSKLENKAWAVKKNGGQFDALTGATVTSRAVIRAIYKGLEYVQMEANSLYTESATGEGIE